MRANLVGLGDSLHLDTLTQVRIELPFIAEPEWCYPILRRRWGQDFPPGLDEREGRRPWAKRLS